MKHRPNLFEIFRTDTSSESSAIAHLTKALKPIDINWNYVDGTKRAMYSYKGEHRLSILTSCLASKVGTEGHKYNKELVEAVAPLAFGRDTKVIVPPKQLFAMELGAKQRIGFLSFLSKTVLSKHIFCRLENTNVGTLDKLADLRPL